MGSMGAEMEMNLVVGVLVVERNVGEIWEQGLVSLSP
jgi:hypothetical protein